MSATVIETPIAVTDETFEDAIRTPGKLVLVDFWAEWCAPCRTIAPILDEIAAEFATRLVVAKVNVDEGGGKAVAYGVRAIPTLMLFKDGEILQSFVGVRSKAELREAIDAALS